MSKKIVYIAHPISGDFNNNMESIRKIYAAISREYPECVPFAPYWITCYALSDEIPTDRALGFSHNREFFERGLIDEVWVFGMSRGVETEIEWANEFGIKVVDRREKA